MPRSEPLSIFDTMPFGKYRGTLMGTIAEDDPGYIEWLARESEVELAQELLDYAQDNK